MSALDVKPTSNRKPGSRSEAASEPFKRAVVSCTRALARNPELEVAFSSDKPALVTGPEGAKARLPEPPRKPSAREAAILRGVANSFALRLACHSEAVHRRLAPQNPAARALFDAVEQARVEAIGARRMEGVAANLSAMLDERYAESPFAEARTRDEAPLEEAVAMLARERLTGLKPPAGAERLTELWRGFSRRRPGRTSTGSATPSSTSAPTRGSSRSCSPRSASRARRTPTPRTRRRRREAAARGAGRGRGEGDESQSQDRCSARRPTTRPTTPTKGAMDTVDAPRGKLEEEGEAGDADEAAENRPPPRVVASADPNTRPIPNSTRPSAPRTVRPGRIAAPARLSRKQFQNLGAVVRGSPTGCSAG